MSIGELDDFDTAPDDLDDDSEPDADPIDWIQTIHDVACQAGADCSGENVKDRW
jgi:hypothetical protein